MLLESRFGKVLYFQKIFNMLASENDTRREVVCSGMDLQTLIWNIISYSSKLALPTDRDCHNWPSQSS